MANQSSKTLQTEVADALKARIFSAIEAGDGRLPPFRTLSRTLGVSDTTVRRALRSLSDEGLISMRQGSGIYISSALKAAPRTVAIVYRVASEASIRSPWHSQLLHDVDVQLERTGWIARNYTLSHGTEKRDERAMDQLIEDARNRKFAGVIILTEFDNLRDGFRELLHELNIKYLTTNYFEVANAVFPDYFEFGQRAAMRLYEQGVRKMGLLGIRNIFGKPLCQELGGMMAFAHTHPDVEIRPEWTPLILPTIGNGYDAFEKLWSLPERPEGLVVSDEVMFLGVSMVMNKLGVVYPDDVQLVAHGTQGAVERNSVNPPRYCYSAQRMASVMVALLQSMIHDDVMEVPVTRVGGMLTASGTGAEATSKEIAGRGAVSAAAER